MLILSDTSALDSWGKWTVAVKFVAGGLGLSCLSVTESVKREQTCLWDLLQSGDCIPVSVQHIPSAGSRESVCSDCLLPRGLLCTWFTQASDAPVVPTSAAVRAANLCISLLLPPWLFICRLGLCLFHDETKWLKKIATNIYKEIQGKKQSFQERHWQTLWPILGCWKVPELQSQDLYTSPQALWMHIFMPLFPEPDPLGNQIKSCYCLLWWLAAFEEG